MIPNLKELVDENIISQETADNIVDYYHAKQNKAPNRLVAIFGIIGAVLIGLGIILIIAHNWDNLSRFTKSILAFLPLVIGQIACAYTLIKKKDEKVWLETASTFLFFGVGASISLISQIYHINGNITDFLFTWMVLTLPQIYILNSSTAALWYITGITYYAVVLGFDHYPSTIPVWYWILLLGVVPHYFSLLKNSPMRNYTILLNRLFPVSILVVLATCARSNEELMFISYMSLCSAFFIIGSHPVFTTNEKQKSIYTVLGRLGIIITLIPLTFEDIWKNLFNRIETFPGLLFRPEFISVVATTLLATYVLIKHDHLPKNQPTSIFKYSFVVFILLFFSAAISPKLAEILSNLMLLAIGIRIINEGIKNYHLGMLNFGLLVIATDILAKFFDTEISFVIRGLSFIGLGILFFAANYLLIQKKKAQ